ncbi:ErmE/ErmH/ErmO/ErmR family 23S rRNA (adenine(2058)-N(6))-methyltransferase [Nocardia otitidiscaviarum]|uniref:ErmE/ErmH/ErmO/ErmR family 23S rRNA (adenine(2058)-N(6))-methyltransferase n=1 Tax=Nocardia otitidiscaviarum TaxID=1823 RepID=UPI001893065A|nr:ErmE/ErmH/ErmO/ErmR family 23S rRNA (adenine(2058)-N(6))-methyltransferase [Nocardia otitidiscaviarum]MBF6236435.1 ErmE/ErmH/ErmO/ErmR family 23S rRNA (adenine(2058)-N(6))-methyltransferase [Nocardia otitidiscaviarum]
MAQDFAHRNYSHTQRKVTSGSGARTPRDHARRTLSQNFLVNRDAVRLMVAVAEPTGLVLEPGAGEGVLTTELARRGARVIAYEIDPLLAMKLSARTRRESGIRVVRGDFTKARAPREPFAVVGNIPYSVTAKIVDWCLTAPALTSATLLTQREYARKRTGDYGRWSLVTAETWPWFTWELHGQVDRTSFRPVPSVDSAILRIVRRPEPLVRERNSYLELVRTGFTGLGGSVRASLRTRYQGVDEALAVAGIDRDTVVAYVHPDQWVTLHQQLAA